MEDGFTVIEEFNDLLQDDSLKNVHRSFFAVYDGHGGDGCMKFLRDSLHLELAKTLVETQGDTEKALTLAFEWTEEKWMQQVTSAPRKKADTSGSTATVCLIEGNEVFCAYLGDSPAFVIHHKTKRASLSHLSEDHKPNAKLEQQRIKNAGGKVKKPKKGVHRVYPGGFAVSRAFGDPHGKLEEFGGKNGLMIADPDICRHVLNSDSHFLLLCTDGVTDNVDDKKEIYMPLLKGYEPGMKEAKKNGSVDYNVATTRMATEVVTSLSKIQGYQDNATALVIMFEETRHILEKEAKATLESLDTVHQLNNIF